MPKMRGIKPEIWTDEKFVELSPYSRLLFVGMWHYACDNGHLDDKPKQLKMRVLPVDSVDAADLIDEMVNLGMVMREDEGLTIPKLRDHQRLDNRYFTWCDRCELADIPEPARSKHPDIQRGHDERTTGTRRDNDEPRVKEGRKEGEGEGELVEFERPAGRSRKKPANRLPDNWEPTEDHKDRTIQDGIDLATQVERFKAHAEANDRRQVNWNATFTQWLLNVPDWQRNPRTNGTAFPANGTEAEQDAWVKAQPLPTDGAYYGGSRR